MQGRVGGPFIGRELEVQRDGVEAREESAGEIGDGELEDRRAHQLREPGQDSGVARRCCREAESSARDHHLERFVPEAGTEMMDLVDDDETESVAELGHVPVCALEGGHRHGSEMAGAVPIAPDGALVHGGDLAQPLVQQDACRHQAERAQARFGGSRRWPAGSYRSPSGGR